jgi:hypothetical protein
MFFSADRHRVAACLISSAWRGHGGFVASQRPQSGLTADPKCRGSGVLHNLPMVAVKHFVFMRSLSRKSGFDMHISLANSLSTALPSSSNKAPAII